MVLMGSGDEQYVELLRGLEKAYPGRVVAYVGYSTELEHKVRERAGMRADVPWGKAATPHAPVASSHQLPPTTTE